MQKRIPKNRYKHKRLRWCRCGLFHRDCVEYLLNDDFEGGFLALSLFHMLIGTSCSVHMQQLLKQCRRHSCRRRRSHATRNVRSNVEGPCPAAFGKGQLGVSFCEKGTDSGEIGWWSISSSWPVIHTVAADKL